MIKCCTVPWYLLGVNTGCNKTAVSLRTRRIRLAVFQSMKLMNLLRSTASSVAVLGALNIFLLPHVNSH